MTTDHDEPQSAPKLFRSKANRLIGGVCGGIAEYFNIDPFMVRIGWVFLIPLAGAGIIAYIAALIIVPENPGQQYTAKKAGIGSDSAKLWGTVLIILGGLLLLKQTGILNHLHFWSFPWQAFLAIALIGFGVYIMYSRSTGTAKMDDESGSNAGFSESKTANNSFYRINENKMIAGVCAGLAHYFNIDVTLIRLLWVLSVLASGGLAIIAYIIAIIVFPIVSPQTKNRGDQ